MNIMSQMSQWSQASDIPTSAIQPSQDSRATSAAGSQDEKINPELLPAHSAISDVSVGPRLSLPVPEHEFGFNMALETEAEPGAHTWSTNKGFTAQWLSKMSPYHGRKVIRLLVKGTPKNMKDYTEHLYKVACLLYDGAITPEQTVQLERKYKQLTAAVNRYAQTEDPLQQQLHIVVARCFDVFIKMAMNLQRMELATHTIRFLTSLVMALNYWEVYTLLRARPAIYQFLTLVSFDFHECYARFVRDSRAYAHTQQKLDNAVLCLAEQHAGRRKRRGSFSPNDASDNDDDNDNDNDHYNDNDSTSFETQENSLSSPVKRVVPRKRPRVDPKPARASASALSEFKAAASRSSNYDPDVVHECQLPAPENPSKVCLRRFSRKYELIRHQETVHSKKKKLFKCYVCVKQDPSIGPRIFTRHDTLAKHIRVNHRISGKEAKAEVAYLKKHAEIVEEGDITVQVGRRKTKVDFELRAHMEKKGSARQAPDGSIVFDEIDESAPDSIQSGDEELVY